MADVVVEPTRLSRLLSPLRFDFTTDASFTEFAARWASPTAPTEELEPALVHLAALYSSGQAVDAAKRTLRDEAKAAQQAGHAMVAAMWERMLPKKGEGAPQKIADRVLIANADRLVQAIMGNKPFSRYCNYRNEKTGEKYLGDVERFVVEFLAIVDPGRKVMPSRNWYRNIELAARVY